MENDYIKNFQRKQITRKYIFWAILLILALGIPIWFYTYSYLETADFGIEKLGLERYNERNRDALLFAFFILIFNSIIALPFFISINTFFKRYKTVLQRLNAEEIKTLKKINNALRGYDKFMPSFIITSQSLFVFSLQLYVIPFKMITSHKFTIQHTKNGFMYKVNINTSDGNHYNFNISSNPVQLEQLKLRLNKVANFT